MYSPDTLVLLSFVARARRLGLTLAEIAHIVALRRAGSAPCVHVRGLLEQKAADLAELLREVRRALKSWRATDGLTAVICPTSKGREVRSYGQDHSFSLPAVRALPGSRH